MMGENNLQYYNCGDLTELEDNAKNVLRIALKRIEALPETQVPLINLVEIDELQKKIAAYQLEIKRRCLPTDRTASLPQDTELFISYASADSVTAEALATSLRRMGISVFFAPASIRNADSYVDSINRGLAACRAAIILWSAAARDSVWVKNEMNFLTIRRNRGDVVLEIIGLEPIEVPPLLQDLQRRNLFGRGVDDVVREIAADLAVGR
jgi:TIR domain